MQPNSLGSIIGQIKSVCTKRMRDAGFRDFGWQSGFYDHIIRDEETLCRIRHYVASSAAKWKLDENNPANGRR